MSRINLLPGELKTNSYVPKISRKLQKFAFILLFVFVAIGVVCASFLVIYQNKLDNLDKEESTLTNQIKALSKTEQKVVLIEDRAVKIQGVLDKVTASNHVRVVNDLVKSFAPDIQVYSLTLGADTSIAEFIASDLNKMSDFLQSVMGSDKLKGSTLTEFKFAASSGYIASIEIKI